jgi:acetylornithine deacetylase/succinyl-diaminopimelate desuccinylase-like protein
MLTITAESGLVDELRRLVAIPSVNPLEEDDPSVCGEAAMGAYLAGALEARGFRVAVEEPAPGRPNVIGVWGPDPGRRTVMLEAHLDTVSVRGMTVPPFDGGVRNGRLYGRGACDMKGALAACLWSLQPALLDRLAGAGWRVIVVGAMGEEQGCEGARALVEAGLLRADETIVLEPTELSIVHAHKGCVWVRADGRGRSGHGSDPDAGVNAIEGMARWMRRVRDRTAAEAGTSDLLGRGTLNIGRIEGGSGINIIPDCCLVHIDRRTVPGEEQDDILAMMREELDALVRSGALTGGELSVVKSAEPYQSSAQGPLVQRLSLACRQEGVPPRTGGTAWYSDAGPLSHLSAETVVFGPGSIRQAHTADEYIELASLQQGADILRTFLTLCAVEEDRID